MKGIWWSGPSKHLERLVFLAILFLAPSQIAYHFWPEFSFIFGIRVDYLSPTLYLTDILIIFLFAIWLSRKRASVENNIFKHLSLFFPALAFVLVNLAFAKSFGPALYKWLKLTEFSFLIYYTSTLKKMSGLTKILSASLVVFSLPAILQFLLQKTTGGLLYWLGERAFSISTPGIALVEILGRQYLRAYSTFSHPNSLAGYFGLALIMIFLFTKKKKKLFLVSALLGSTAFLLTFSWGAFLGIFSVVIFYLVLTKKKIFVKQAPRIFLMFALLGSILAVLLVPPKASGESLVQRVSLAKVSFKMLKTSPLFGVGLNNFVVMLPEHESPPSLIWSLQPVHNIFLLVLAETGIIGLSFLILLVHGALVLVSKRNSQLLLPFLFVFVTGVMDHYWITLQQNQILLSLLFGLSLTKARLVD